MPGARHTPLPAALSGEIVERLIRVDRSLLPYIAGALEYATDRERYDQTGTLTVDQARELLGEMIYVFYTEQPQMTIIGATMWIPFPDIPDKWLLMDGSAISRTEYAKLFEVLGVVWGAGDGSTTFNLPDLVGRSPMGAGMPTGGTVNMVFANKYGEQLHELTIGEIPAHAHQLTGTWKFAGASNRNSTTGGTVNHNATVDTNLVGGGGLHNTIHPVTVGKFIIYAGE